MDAGARAEHDVAWPSFWFAALSCGALSSAVYLLVHAQATMLGLTIALPAALPWSAALAGAITALARRRRARAAQPKHVAWWMLSLSLALSAMGPLWRVVTAEPVAAAIVGTLMPAFGGHAIARVTRATLAELVPVFRFLGMPRGVFGPWSVLSLLAAGAIGAGATASLGPWPASALAGVVLAALGAWFVPLYTQLQCRGLSGAGRIQLGAMAAMATGGASFLASATTLAAARAEIYDKTVVFTAGDPAAPIVITSTPLGYELYFDHALRISALDAHRYYESLVHPALVTAPRVRRVLVLGAGDALVEREVLRHSEVEHVSAVALSAELVELGRSSSWLRRLSGNARGSARVHTEVAEPTAWLSKNKQRYDVIVADLPDPGDFFHGKHYTRHFYAELAERLTDGGVMVAQATSALTLPRTASSIAASLRASGLWIVAYHAPIPSYGQWTFLLASRTPLDASPRRPLPDGLRFLRAAELTALVATPNDTALDPTAPPSMLFDQQAVRSFADERDAL